MVAFLIKNDSLAAYPADVVVDGKFIKFEEIFKLDVKFVVAKWMPSTLIKNLRENGIVFLKLNSLEEFYELDLSLSFNKDTRIKRGVGCQLKFKGGI